MKYNKWRKSHKDLTLQHPYSIKLYTLKVLGFVPYSCLMQKMN